MRDGQLRRRRYSGGAQPRSHEDMLGLQFIPRIRVRQPEDIPLRLHRRCVGQATPWQQCSSCHDIICTQRLLCVQLKPKQNVHAPRRAQPLLSCV